MCRAGEMAQSLKCLPPSMRTRVCSLEAPRGTMARKVGMGISQLPAAALTSLVSSRTMRHPVSKEMDHVPEGNGQGSLLLMYVDAHPHIQTYRFMCNKIKYQVSKKLKRNYKVLINLEGLLTLRVGSAMRGRLRFRAQVSQAAIADSLAPVIPLGDDSSGVSRVAPAMAVSPSLIKSLEDSDLLSTPGAHFFHTSPHC